MKGSTAEEKMASAMRRLVRGIIFVAAAVLSFVVVLAAMFARALVE